MGTEHFRYLPLQLGPTRRSCSNGIRLNPRSHRPQPPKDDMSIATKTGDTGNTALTGGTRVSKADLRVEAYGTIDELNAVLGFARSLCADEEVRTRTEEIQRSLFRVGAALSRPLGDALDRGHNHPCRRRGPNRPGPRDREHRWHSLRLVLARGASRVGGV